MEPCLFPLRLQREATGPDVSGVGQTMSPDKLRAAHDSSTTNATFTPGFPVYLTQSALKP